MSDKSNFWLMLLSLITRLLGLSNKTPNSSTSGDSNSPLSLEEAKSEVKDIAKDFIEKKAIELGTEYISMLRSLNPKQKEFALKMAVLKAVDKSELTLEETLELGDLINEAARLNLEITSELSSFWNKFGSVTAEILEKVANIGVRVAARTLMSYIPI